jgi:hypothetical protein
MILIVFFFPTQLYSIISFLYEKYRRNIFINVRIDYLMSRGDALKFIIKERERKFTEKNKLRVRWEQLNDKRKNKRRDFINHKCI